MNVTFINARFSDGRYGSLRIHGGRIAALDAPPDAVDTVIDLQGDRLLPGFINAHDHLQLNSLPEHETHQFYRHARDWAAEVDVRRRIDPQFEAGASIARDERLLMGGLKNLLSGVTTVAHHDPLYPYLTRADFPVSVVRDYGWSHSLYIDGELSVAEAYRATPSAWPWIVHAAEGLDVDAAAEFELLDALGCLGANTVLVHGVALGQSQRSRLLAAGAALVWCPSSNMRLFGVTAEVTDLIARHRVALGTDSRLSGARDLLEELRLASSLGAINDAALEALVTHVSAAVLRLSDRGALRPGQRADLLVLPANAVLRDLTRPQIRLVMLAGSPKYGDPDYAMKFSPGAAWTGVSVDGAPKMLDGHIAAVLAQTAVCEPGVTMKCLTGRAA